MERYSVLLSAKPIDLIESIKMQKCEGQIYNLLCFDADAGENLPITGYIINPDNKTIILYTDSDNEFNDSM